MRRRCGSNRQPAAPAPGRTTGLPEHVQATAREGEGGRFLYLLNHGQEPAEVTLPGPMTDVLAPRAAADDRLTLPVAGVAVLTKR